MSPEPIRLLVCGGRDYADRDAVYRALDAVHAMSGVVEVIHGDARGADRLAGAWARERGLVETPVKADWVGDGKRAGPIRNRKMLKMLLDGPRPIGVVAFPGGRGTADMVVIACEAGVHVWEPIASGNSGREPITRHSWEKLREHRYRCTRCGMLKANVEREGRWRMALWMPGERAEFHERMPPCEPGEFLPIVQGRYPRADEILAALTRGANSDEARIEREAIMEYDGQPSCGNEGREMVRG